MARQRLYLRSIRLALSGPEVRAHISQIGPWARSGSSKEQSESRSAFRKSDSKDGLHFPVTARHSSIASHYPLRTPDQAVTKQREKKIRRTHPGDCPQPSARGKHRAITLLDWSRQGRGLWLMSEGSRRSAPTRRARRSGEELTMQRRCVLWCPRNWGSIQ